MSTQEQNKNARPFIFISNDDGYNFPGIKALIEVAMEFGDVLVAAPLNHQSGKASSISVNDPLRSVLVEERKGLKIYAVNGTPADCAKLGLGVLVGDRKVDLVLAGVNHGMNHGNSVIYSGTMGIVFEGLMAGFPSVAFSYDNYSPKATFEKCVPVMRHIIARVLERGLPFDVCLNVNIPAIEGDFKGVKITTTAPGVWTNTWDHRVDTHGMDYYWMLGEYDETNTDDDRTDLYWLRRGWVSVTPVHIDQTDFQSMSAVDKLING